MPGLTGCAVHVSVAGSYTSTAEMTDDVGENVDPTTSTLPSGCRMAATGLVFACMFAIALQDPVTGS
jgi:hypothetical protein